MTASYNNIRDLVEHAAKTFPDTAFFLSQDDAFPSVTGLRLYETCGKAALVLPGQGMHIGILGPNSAAWLTAFFSVISSGNVAVPLSVGLPAEELQACVRQADVELLLYDGVCAKETADIQVRDRKELHSFLQELFSAEGCEYPLLSRDGPAALYFTSGTTGRSRCVILTHRNLASQANAVLSVLPLDKTDVGLSILPLSHTFELSTYITGALHCGGTLYMNESLRTVKPNLKRCRPTVLIAVPLILQTLHKEIINTARRKGKLNALERGLRLNHFLRLLGFNAGRRLFREVYEQLGGSLKTVVCGGASLDRELLHFFYDLGIDLLQGYGITECSPVVATNTPEHNRLGSIGRTLSCCETAIIDGEICVRGESVSPGYYADLEATAESFRDGWFHTGDLGRIDREGYLYFTGRKKNLIILSNGENVCPEEIEEKLYMLEGVIDAVVYERGGKITAELYADPSVIPDKASAWALVNHMNRGLAVSRRVGELVLRDEPFEKTSTEKIKRYVLKEG